MQTAASKWQSAFRRLVSLSEQANAPIVCDLPRWSPDEIERHFAYIEMRIGVALPPSYREFLSECDGCDNLFRGAGLLSLAQMLDPTHAGAADILLEDLNTPIPSFVAPLRPHWRDENLICIGMDRDGDIVFVFDPGSLRSDGEMEVIAWIAGLGIRLTSLAHLFDFLGDLMDTSDLGEATIETTEATTQVRVPSESAELAAYIAA